jgi:branched-chain amino acid aminotransferase
MQHSADVASMPRVPVDMFVQACRSVVARNACFVPPHQTGAALYLRPQLYGSSAQLNLTAPEEYTFAIFAVPTGVVHGAQPIKALILDEFDRTAPNGAGHAKLGGNYCPVLRWSDRAKREGYGITLHLDSASHQEIDEFSTCGFVGITQAAGGDVTVAVPDSACVIDSVTSESVLHIARSFGWKAEKRPIRYTELPGFTEVVAVGTAASLVPIRSITRRNQEKLLLPEGPRVQRGGDGTSETIVYLPDSQTEAGPLCTQLTHHLKAIQTGKIEDQFGWRWAVSAKDMAMETV